MPADNADECSVMVPVPLPRGPGPPRGVGDGRGRAGRQPRPSHQLPRHRGLVEPRRPRPGGGGRRRAVALHQG